MRLCLFFAQASLNLQEKLYQLFIYIKYNNVKLLM